MPWCHGHAVDSNTVFYNNALGYLGLCDDENEHDDDDEEDEDEDEDENVDEDEDEGGTRVG